MNPFQHQSFAKTGFVSDLKNTTISYSFEGMDRLFRAHGHTLHDIAHLRAGQFLRIPDIVVWPGVLVLKPEKYLTEFLLISLKFPENHSHVEELMALATKHNVAIVPIGGGTNVTGAVDCSPDERRMIVSLDTSQMVTC